MEPSGFASPQKFEKPSQGVSFFPRAVAQIIDLVLHNIIALGAGIMIGVFIVVVAVIRGVSPEVLAGKLETATISGYIFPLIGYVVYHAICESMHGATLGKLIMKIRVVNENGNACSFGKALLRSVAFYLDSLLFGLIAAGSMQSSDLRQRLGDKWAHTVVIGHTQPVQYMQPSGWQFAFVFLGAVMADGLIFALSLFLKLLS